MRYSIESISFEAISNDADGRSQSEKRRHLNSFSVLTKLNHCDPLSARAFTQHTALPFFTLLYELGVLVTFRAEPQI